MDLNILEPACFLFLKMRVLALFSLMEKLLTWHCKIRFVSVLTSSYLPLSLGYNLLPHNFIVKSSSNFFLLRLKDHHFSFFKISEILFPFNQITRCFKSALTSLLSCLLEVLRHNHCFHQQSGELRKILLLDWVHLYTAKM